MIQPLQQIRQLRLTWQTLPVRWGIVGVFAIAQAYADGFWLTAVQGALGVAKQSHAPINRWLADSSLLLPASFLVLFGMLCTLAPKQRRMRSAFGQFALTLLVISMVGSSVAAIQVGVRTIQNYRTQIDDLQRAHGEGTFQSVGGEWVSPVTSAPISYTVYCSWRNALRGSAGDANTTNDRLLQREYAVFGTYLRAFSYNIGLVLISNSLITLLMLLFLGEYLWVAPPKPIQA